MTYDQWKTTDPRDYEPVDIEDDCPTELDLAHDRIQQLEFNSQSAARRIAELTAALTEALEYFKDRYDIRDGADGQQLPNKEMSLGMMIDEALHGIRF